MKNEGVLPPAVSQNIQSDSPLYILGVLLRRHPFVFLLAFVVTATFLTITLSFASDTKLVAASYSDRYHLPSCKIAQKIAPEDLKKFNSPEEAVAAGFIPCKKCSPPVSKDYMRGKMNFSTSKKSADTNTQS